MKALPITYHDIIRVRRPGLIESVSALIASGSAAASFAHTCKFYRA